MISTARKTMLVLLVAATACFGTIAQDGSRPAPAERAKKQTERMKTELHLADDQYNKVGEINLKYAEMNEAEMSSGGGRMAHMNAIKANMKQKDAEMKKVLTEQQYEKYLEMQAEMRAKMKSRAGR